MAAKPGTCCPSVATVGGDPVRCAWAFVIGGAEHSVGGMHSLAVVFVVPLCDFPAGLRAGGDVPAAQQVQLQLNISATFRSRNPICRQPRISGVSTNGRVRVSLYRRGRL